MYVGCNFLLLQSFMSYIKHCCPVGECSGKLHLRDFVMNDSLQGNAPGAVTAAAALLFKIKFKYESVCFKMVILNPYPSN